MCYDIEEGHRTLIRKAIRIGAPADQLNEMIEQYNKRYNPIYPISPVEDVNYHVSGFEHPLINVIYLSEHRIAMEEMRWGLIPPWCKDMETAIKMWNKTINARSETMFEKPSFRKAASARRGIIIINSFFEHHHFKGKVYPFNIRRGDTKPMVLAVLFSEWVNRQTGEILKTFSIVTVRGNLLLSKIHNNPKLPEPRMPLILNGKEELLRWINTKDGNEHAVSEICNPLPEGVLKAYPVRKLRGKLAVGNVLEAIEPFNYPELDTLFLDT